MEQPIEKHQTANRRDIFVKPLPAPLSPAEGQLSADAGSGAIPEYQFIDRNISPNSLK
jgi:hypothetical protein